MRTLITGATGLVGTKLCAALPDVVVLTRDPARARRDLPGHVVAHEWDPYSGPPPAEALDGVEGVVHLAGAPIADKRWSPSYKATIRRSREVPTRHLVAGLQAMAAPPRAFVSTSAIGYYGDRGDTVLTEQSAAGEGFLTEVCTAWEREALAASETLRTVVLRLGVVLSARGGALAKMLPAFKLGAGGPIAGGAQWMSWIHEDDVVALIRFALAHPTLSGPVNAVAPGAVTNRTFTRVLARTLNRPAFLGVPRFALRGAMGEVASLLTDSQRVEPARALEADYTFIYPELESALKELIA